MRSLKWRYLQELEARARKRDAKVGELGSDAFVQIMVLDAYFIIERPVQRSYGAKRGGERVHELEWCLPLLRNDKI